MKHDQNKKVEEFTDYFTFPLAFDSIVSIKSLIYKNNY